MGYKTDLFIAGLAAVTAVSLYTAYDAMLKMRKQREEYAPLVSQFQNAVKQSGLNGVVVTPETIADYEFHPFLNNPGSHPSDFSQESQALGKISFDAEQPSSLEKVLRNIVSVAELNSTEPVSLRTLWQYEKGPPTGPPTYSSDRGQGLIVSDQGHMLTAAHVVVDDEDKFHDWNPYATVTRDKSVYEVERILAISEKYDLALVKTSYHPEKFVPPSFSTSPKPGETYTLVGVKMSGNLRVNLNNSSSITIKNPKKIKFTDYYSQGVFESADASLQRYDGTKQFFTDMFIMDQHSQPGFSGSVAADQQGKIIGFVSGQRGDNQAIVAKSARVKELLEKYLEKIKPKP